MHYQNWRTVVSWLKDQSSFSLLWCPNLLLSCEILPVYLLSVHFLQCFCNSCLIYLCKVAPTSDGKKRGYEANGSERWTLLQAPSGEVPRLTERWGGIVSRGSWNGGERLSPCSAQRLPPPHLQTAISRRPPREGLLRSLLWWVFPGSWSTSRSPCPSCGGIWADLRPPGGPASPKESGDVLIPRELLSLRWPSARTRGRSPP